MPITFIKRFFLPASLALLTFMSAPSYAIDMVSTKGGAPSKLNSEVSEGDWSLVMLWSHDCIPCEKQKPMIERFYRQTNARGVSVVGLSTDEKALRAKAAETYRATTTTFPNYFFNGRNFQQEFQQFSGQSFLGTPTYMVFSPKGELTGVHTGAITRAMLEKAFGSKLREKKFTPSTDLLQ